MNIEDVELLKENAKYGEMIRNAFNVLSTHYSEALSHGINLLVYEKMQEMNGRNFITLAKWDEPYEEYILSRVPDAFKSFEKLKVYRRAVKMLQEEFQEEEDPLMYEIMEKTLEYFFREYYVSTIKNELLYDLFNKFEYVDNIQILHILITVYGGVLSKDIRDTYEEKYRKDVFYHILDTYKPVEIEYLTQCIPPYETKDELYNDIAYAVSKIMSSYTRLDEIEELYDYSADIVDGELEYDDSIYSFIKFKVYLAEDAKKPITTEYKAPYFYRDVHLLEELMFKVAYMSYFLQKDFPVFDEKINQTIKQLVKEIGAVDKKYRKNLLDAAHKVEGIMEDIVLSE